ncbi:MAG TPA: TIM barrel protein, partial [Ardenticatenaceae bacterium]|nr:TIM barrel protein [Ardenticatenaceae bacterium]
MKPGIHGLSFGADHPLDGDILVAAVHRFAYLDIAAAKLQQYLEQPDYDIRDLTRLFLRTQPGAVDGLDAVSLDGNGGDALLERAQALFKEARRLGASVVIARVTANAVDDSSATATSASLADLAGKWSVRLALAPAFREDGPVSYGGLISLVERLDHPSLGLLLDAVLLARADMLEQPFALQGKSVAHVHVADAGRDGSGPRLLPGAGVLPLAALLRHLAATGYEGIVSVALDGPPAEMDAGEL